MDVENVDPNNKNVKNAWYLFKNKNGFLFKNKKP